MKKEFSFYEFVGIIVPSVIFLYSAHLIIEFVYQKQIVDFGEIGETAIFVIVCYGVGHILQSLGNVFESIVWFIYGGIPTKWLTSKNRFGNSLFDKPLNDKIADKVKLQFGEDITDYGRLTYNFVFLKDKTVRIDIFNGNYSLFRGLSVSFLLITIMCGFYFDWLTTSLATIPFILSIMRMVRFAKYYATETFRTFYNLSK
ncbi:MAG: hypothetical protein L6Q81_12265 [Bacteroidia bacterium]|nr:hypothetical protein [Bacteroidia bacterium]